MTCAYLLQVFHGLEWDLLPNNLAKSCSSHFTKGFADTFSTAPKKSFIGFQVQFHMNREEKKIRNSTKWIFTACYCQATSKFHCIKGRWEFIGLDTESFCARCFGSSGIAIRMQENDYHFFPLCNATYFCLLFALSMITTRSGTGYPFS